MYYSQLTFLTSGFGLTFKKKKKKNSLCSLTGKLSSANPPEASPVTSTNTHDLYMCFTSGHTTDSPGSLPHGCFVVVVLDGLFLWGLLLPLTDAVQTSKPFAAGGLGLINIIW